jgi:hypothetical protein
LNCYPPLKAVATPYPTPYPVLSREVDPGQLVDHQGKAFKSKKTGLYSWMKNSHTVEDFLTGPFESLPVTTDLTMPQDDAKQFNYPTYHPKGEVLIYLNAEGQMNDENIEYHRSAEEGETVFSEGGWNLAKAATYDYDPPGYNDDRTFIWHYCEERQWRNYPDGDHLMVYGTCDECNEPVPDSVLVVWKIQNIDTLPCGDMWTPFILPTPGARGHQHGVCDDPWCICGESEALGFGPIVPHTGVPTDPNDIEVVDNIKDELEKPLW